MPHSMSAISAADELKSFTRTIDCRPLSREVYRGIPRAVRADLLPKGNAQRWETSLPYQQPDPLPA